MAMPASTSTAADQGGREPADPEVGRGHDPARAAAARRRRRPVPSTCSASPSRTTSAARYWSAAAASRRRRGNGECAGFSTHRVPRGPRDAAHHDPPLPRRGVQAAPAPVGPRGPGRSCNLAQGRPSRPLVHHHRQPVGWRRRRLRSCRGHRRGDRALWRQRPGLQRPFRHRRPLHRASRNEPNRRSGGCRPAREARPSSRSP